MTILVTGGTGFIGSHTVVELLNAGYDVVIADNLCNSKIEVIDRIAKITNKRPAFYKLDLLDSAALEKVFAENRLDAVIHFAGLKSVAESVEDPGRYLDTNLTSTFHLLNAMETHQVYKLVFSSSATVYGTPETMPNRESDVVGKVCCPYGFSKYLNELLLHDFARQRDNFRFASLRYFNPVGAHPSGLIGEDCGMYEKLFFICCPHKNREENTENLEAFNHLVQMGYIQRKKDDDIKETLLNMHTLVRVVAKKVLPVTPEMCETFLQPMEE